jgi:tetratricopeptide (TPR) repeat protein
MSDRQGPNQTQRQASYGQHEERDHLLRSLDDLDRELAAGDIDLHDYATLRADYTSRAAAILRKENDTTQAPASPISASLRVPLEGSPPTGKLDREPLFELAGSISASLRVRSTKPGSFDSQPTNDGSSSDSSTGEELALDGSSTISKLAARTENQSEPNVDFRPKRSPARRIMAIVGVLVVAIGSGVAVARFAGERVGSTGMTGTVRQAASPEQQQAEKFMQIGRDNLGSDPIKSLQAFDAALKIDPTIAEAMAYSGWVLRIAAQSAEGKDADDLRAGAIRRINEAILADPTFPDAYAFKGVIALRDQDDPKTALAAFKKLDGLQTPPFVQQLVGSARQEAEEALANPSPN